MNVSKMVVLSVIASVFVFCACQIRSVESMDKEQAEDAEIRGTKSIQVSVDNQLRDAIVLYTMRNGSGNEAECDLVVIYESKEFSTVSCQRSRGKVWVNFGDGSSIICRRKAMIIAHGKRRFEVLQCPLVFELSDKNSELQAREKIENFVEKNVGQ